MLKSTKVRIYPTQVQRDFLVAHFGAVRFSYNKALYLKKHYYRVKGMCIKPKKDLKPLLALAKRTRKYGWLKNFDSISLQQAIINLDKAFDNFLNPKLKTKHPKFKSRRGRQTSYHCIGVKVLSDAVKIPKLGPIKAKLHREIKGKVKSITISCNASGKFFASILSDDNQGTPETCRSIDTAIGIDLGILHFATDSNGCKTDNPRFLLRAERNLKRKMKALSRKKVGGKNRNKSRLIVAKCYEKLTNTREDFQHKLSRKLIDENQAVIVETLETANMLRNYRLSKHIADAVWSGFIEKLAYKANQSGKHLVKVDRFFASTKTCHSCGKKSFISLNDRVWTCNCGITHDRDTNAAINILKQGLIMLKAEGHSVSACGCLHKTSES
ncbi:RNA-guided endonuclease InsQ/TnpB family protein [Idiomarina abyssalis]|uniref:RNA-guided endonuclease InsQ/TnpB family protein n=1 Tax=Idiomarina abyssalis TaxID=86102 RepID=UPI0006C8687B|nr:RNA-guided endonuclease TnpB family protein [Idiomarina abyssalis]KPD20460.1 transposase [Idiomarina abyssalis]SFT88200.1 putative transposase [Idiomarina abyssalis]